MDRKNTKFKKTDEGKKAVKFKKGSRYNCNVCGMGISVYESCECLDAIDIKCCDRKMMLS